MTDLRQTIADNPTASDAEIAALYNDRAGAWQPVKSPSVLAWLGEAARQFRLKAFVAQTTAAYAADPAGVPAVALVLCSAVDTTLASTNNPGFELLLDPASPHRQLLSGLVQAGVLTPDDAGALIARARVVDDVTAGQVAAERAAMGRDAAFAAARAAEEADHVRRVGLIDAAYRDGADAPTLISINAEGEPGA